MRDNNINIEPTQDPYLQQIPVVLESLELENKGDTLSIIFNNDKKVQNFFRKIGFKIPKHTKIELDDYASFVFLQIDGQKTIYEIGQILYEAKGANADPLYERLLLYLDFLNTNKKWIYYKNEHL